MTNHLEDVDRRSVLKTIGAGAVVGTVHTGTAAAEPDTVNTPPPITPPETLAEMWGSNGKDNWAFRDTGLRPDTGQAPFFELIYFNRDRFDGCFSPHIEVDIDGDGTVDAFVDFVAPSPGDREYNANWHVHAVFDVGDLSRAPTPSEVEESGLATPGCWNEEFDDIVPCGSPNSSGQPFIFTCPVQPKDCPE